MKHSLLKAICLLVGTATPATAFANDCGSDSDDTNSFFKYFVVPQTFPVFSPLVQFPTATSAFCLAVPGGADFQEGCRNHDACYDTYGADRASCDEAARQDWMDACLYPGVVFLHAASMECLGICRTVAQLMYESVDERGEGPFAAAQAAAHFDEFSDEEFYGFIVAAIL